jgi:hypothetical protein
MFNGSRIDYARESQTLQEDSIYSDGARRNRKVALNTTATQGRNSPLSLAQLIGRLES